jgi:hypothetical protein
MRFGCAQIAIHILRNMSNLQKGRLKGLRKGA